MKQDDARKILQQGHNVLLTGAAGSGKTYLLESFANWARDQKSKVSVTATTGLAATNINGTTIHNWSGIGVRNQTQLEDKDTIRNIVNNMLPRYQQAIKRTDILIIDEVSMLHSYQLEAIDKIVRGVRENQNLFGDMQVVLCGDFFQLSPITQRGEQLHFIIESTAYQNGKFEVCYLEEFYRHNKDDSLTKLLNAIRANNFTRIHWNILNSRINKQLHASTITKICTTNKQADDINKIHLDELPGDSKEYIQQSEGEGQPMRELLKICKNKVVPQLYLKVGSVVMFNKNEPTGKYFNGSLGKVVSFSDDGWPNVQLNDKIEDEQIVPGKLLNDIKFTDFYTEDENGQRLATIRQLPLKLAWAITVHKSQGMTIDAARIDLSNTFADGLGYVALSRVRSIQDLSITGINNRAVRVNQIALSLENRLQELSARTQNLIHDDE
ncbi:MAG: AAA family ATPase, partial [Bacteroidota bacterium]|nr:AAA family ATPase [Bacteroidota bacterium]